MTEQTPNDDWGCRGFHNQTVGAETIIEFCLETLKFLAVLIVAGRNAIGFECKLVGDLNIRSGFTN